MNQVVLSFPDTYSLSDFICLHQISNVEVDSKSVVLRATLAEEEILIACKKFEASVVIGDVFNAIDE